VVGGWDCSTGPCAAGGGKRCTGRDSNRMGAGERLPSAGSFRGCNSGADSAGLGCVTRRPSGSSERGGGTVFSRRRVVALSPVAWLPSTLFSSSGGRLRLGRWRVGGKFGSAESIF